MNINLVKLVLEIKEADIYRCNLWKVFQSNLLTTMKVIAPEPLGEEGDILDHARGHFYTLRMRTQIYIVFKIQNSKLLLKYRI